MRRRKPKLFKKSFITDGNFEFLAPVFENFNDLFKGDKRKIKKKKIPPEAQELIDLLKSQNMLILLFMFKIVSDIIY